MIPLPQVAFFQEGPGVRKDQFRTSGVKLLNVGNLQKGRIALEKTKVYLDESLAYGKYKHFMVDPGDLIIASSGIKVEAFEHKVAFVNESHLPLCMNTSTIRFKTKDAKKLNIKYLSYFFKSDEFKYQIGKLITGSAQLNFGPSHLEKINLPLPPIETQELIVRKLDLAQLALDAREQTLVDTDEYLRALFVEMFGDPVYNTKQWPTKSLEDVSEICRGRFSPRPRNDPAYYGGKYPFIQTGDIANSNYRLKEWSQTLNEKGIKVSKEFKVGTIVVAIVGATIGATSILEIDSYAPDSVIGIVVDTKKVSNVYVEFLLRFFRPVFVAQAPATARANINLDTLKPLATPIPPIELQHAFEKKVKEVLLLQEKMRNSEADLATLLSSMMNQAFVSGKEK